MRNFLAEENNGFEGGGKGGGGTKEGAAGGGGATGAGQDAKAVEGVIWRGRVEATAAAGASISGVEAAGKEDGNGVNATTLELPEPSTKGVRLP